MSRITITCRHTGRFYIGLDAEHFAALQTGFRHLDPAILCEADRRILKAFQSYNDKLRAELALAATPES